MDPPNALGIKIKKEYLGDYLATTITYKDVPIIAIHEKQCLNGPITFKVLETAISALEKTNELPVPDPKLTYLNIKKHIIESKR